MTNKPKFIIFPFTFEGVTYNNPSEMVEEFNKPYSEILKEYRECGTLTEEKVKHKAVKARTFLVPVKLNGKEYKTIEELNDDYRLTISNIQKIISLIKKNKDIAEYINEIVFYHKGKEHLTVETVLDEYNLSSKVVAVTLARARRDYPMDKEVQGMYFESLLVEKDYQYSFLEHKGIHYTSMVAYAQAVGLSAQSLTLVRKYVTKAKTKEDFNSMIAKQLENEKRTI